MNKDRVLFILHLPPPVHGAAMVGNYIRNSEYINKEFDSHYINLATASGLEDIGRFKVKKVISFFRLLFQIRHSVKEIKPQLVYVTPNAKGGPFYKDFIVVMMLKMLNCKVALHFHNKGVSSRQNRKVDNYLYHKFFKGLKVILLSERLYSDIQKYVKIEDVYICPNGIPQRAVHNKSINIESRQIPHVLFLSNLLIEKGVLVLLDALQILKEKGYSFVCNFVGDETADIDANRFNIEVRKRNLSDVASYQGKKYGDDKDGFLEDADIFVFPTFYNNETFGLVNLEAMQHGVPIVTTDEGGIPDVVKDGKNGYICQKNNSKDLADKIEILLNDEMLRKQMGAEGRKKYEQEYTLEIFEKRFSDILRKLIEL